MVETARSHIHEIALPASSETVFDALIKPSAICRWWQASSAIVLPEKNGFWTATWGNIDAPDYITWHRITKYEYPRFLELGETRYVSRFEPPPFELNLKARFEVTALSESESVLKVIQSGFPTGEVADDFYNACEIGWKDTFAGMKAYIESTGK